MGVRTAVLGHADAHPAAGAGSPCQVWPKRPFPRTCTLLSTAHSRKTLPDDSNSTARSCTSQRG